VHEEARRAPNQAVGIARRTASKSVFFGEDFVTSVALIAHYESETSAAVASVLIRAREPFDEAVELAALVKLTDVVGAADVDAADEDAWQGEVAAAAENCVKFVAEAVIDGDVALVDGDAEAAEDGSDSTAVVESAADNAEAGEVDDDALVKARRESSGDGSARGTQGTKYGGGDPDAAE